MADIVLGNRQLTTDNLPLTTDNGQLTTDKDGNLLPLAYQLHHRHSPACPPWRDMTIYKNKYIFL
jgi:hypothetical protein